MPAPATTDAASGGADLARVPRARFAVATGLGSALLFLLEPIAAKRILPLLGGSAAVWSACLVFFQTALLGGYLVAHWLATRVAPPRQRAIYLALVAASVAQLAIAARLRLHADSVHPVASVLALLAALVLLPFVTLAASGPLLQAWYRRATTASPYRLYVVSNAGSLLGLVAYPWLLEPAASLRAQFEVLLAGMLCFGVVATVVARGAAAAASRDHPLDAPRDHTARGYADRGGADRGAHIAVAPTDPPARRLLWVALAACGSLLLSAVTSYISRNVATIPLLWILPLVAYLASFIVAFADERWHPRLPVMAFGLAGLGACAFQLYNGDLHATIPLTVALQCGALFAICLFCHDELYRRRPPAERLTSFYLHLAAGGAAGAFLVGVAAPKALSGNYDLAIGLTMAAALAVLCSWPLGGFARVVTLSLTVLMAMLVRRQVRLDDVAIYRVRNFYGTLRVDESRSASLGAFVRDLQNGIIEHGRQVFRADLVDQPTTYYGRSSGVGLAIQLCCPDRARRIGVIGLGTGTIAAFGRAGDVIRFYDLNPAVEPIARNLFAYLRRSKAAVDVVTGDARISMATEPPQHYDVIAVDAFSGDAIPVHLITSEALALYRRQLAPGGVIAFHVSNRYLRLAAVVRQIAEHAGMAAIDIHSSEDEAHAVFSAEWVLVTSDPALAAAFAVSSDTEAIAVPRGLRRWTDDYNSLLPILRVR